MHPVSLLASVTVLGILHGSHGRWSSLREPGLTGCIGLPSIHTRCGPEPEQARLQRRLGGAFQQRHMLCRLLGSSTTQTGLGILLKPFHGSLHTKILHVILIVCLCTCKPHQLQDRMAALASVRIDSLHAQLHTKLLKLSILYRL